MTTFLSGLFGGLGLGVVLGFILGARAQRQLGLIFKIETAKAQAKARTNDPELLFEGDEGYPQKGTEHPVGPVPPKPNQVGALRKFMSRSKQG